MAHFMGKSERLGIQLIYGAGQFVVDEITGFGIEGIVSDLADIRLTLWLPFR